MDPTSIWVGTHDAANAAAEVRFVENFEKPLCPACYRPRHDGECGGGGPKHRGVRRRKSWRAALVLLRERAWRKSSN